MSAIDPPSVRRRRESHTEEGTKKSLRTRTPQIAEPTYSSRWPCPLLGLIALTGVLLTFDALADRVIYGLSFTAPEPLPPRSRPGSIPVDTRAMQLEELRRV